MIFFNKLLKLAHMGGGTSRMHSRRCMRIDIDSAVKTVYGTFVQDKKYNPLILLCFQPPFVLDSSLFSL